MSEEEAALSSISHTRKTTDRIFQQYFTYTKDHRFEQYFTCARNLFSPFCLLLFDINRRLSKRNDGTT